LEKGARLTTDQKEQIAKQLITAVEKNKEDNVKCLLQCGVSVKTKNKDGKTLITLAAEKGYQSLLKTLAADSKNLVRKDREVLGKKLSDACTAKDIEQAKFLLSVGANTEAKNTNGSTPLVAAAENGQVELARLLLEKGADKKATNRDGRTGLFLAVDKGHAKLAQMFRQSGMTLLATEQEQVAAQLLAASGSGDVPQATLLLECGASADAKDIASETSMHKAAASGHVNICKLLLEKKASVQPHGGEYGTTPLFYACRNKQIEVAKLLVKHGANENDSDPEGGAKYESLMAEANKKGKK